MRGPSLRCGGLLLPLLSTWLHSAAAAELGTCPPKAANASCAAVGCGKYCRGVCGCNSECARYHDCCYDYASCPPAPPPAPHPHPGPAPTPSHPGGPKGGPEQFHISLAAGQSQQGAPITVAFASSTAWNGVPSCSVSLVSAAGPFGAAVIGASHTYTDGGWEGLLHTVPLAAVPWAKPFWYRCAGRNHTFPALAPPAPGHLPVTLAAVADLGENCNRPDGGCGNATIAALAKAAAAGSFSALVHAGDIAYTSGDQNIWDEYMREMEPIASRVPYQVCAGNHEHYYNFSGYRNRFEMVTPTLPANSPSNNIFYSFDFGGVHFAAYSSEHDHSAGSEQVAWLAADLEAAAANRAAVPWIVVFAHRPLYCSTSDYYDCQVNGPKNILPVIEPLLQQAKVDLYLAGHLHNYERTWPVLNGTVAAHSYSDATATVHAVIGMAGCDEGLTPGFVSPAPVWSAKHAAALGYAMLEFESASEMRFTYVLSNTGEALDTFTLTKKR